MKITTNLSTPRVALAVGAHPDDVEFNCGGTLAKWAAQGCRVYILILTDGSMGSWDPKMDRGLLRGTRKHEAIDAATKLGLTDSDVFFLDEPDGQLELSRETIAKVCSVIRHTRPNVILGHDPWKHYRLHPDHREAGLITLDAIVCAREPNYTAGQQEGFHRCDMALLYEAEVEDHIEDVSGFYEHKLTALLAHQSQLLSTMNIQSPNDQRGISNFSDWLYSNLSEKGSLANLSEGEAFKLISQI